MRGETINAITVIDDPKFQSTPLMRGETGRVRRPVARRAISIHSPHARGDVMSMMRLSWRCHFNPLPSCEGRRLPATRLRCNHYFNPLPSCEGRLDLCWCPAVHHVFQSTPLMRGETSEPRAETLLPADFNPLPSCEGRQHKPLKIRLDSRQSIQQKHHSLFF